jgi:hypothetical protein
MGAALFEENADELMQTGGTPDTAWGNALDIGKHGVEATFGLNAGAMAAVDQRRRTRVNRLSGGGGADVSETGVVGLGTAD